MLIFFPPRGQGLNVQFTLMCYNQHPATRPGATVIDTRETTIDTTLGWPSGVIRSRLILTLISTCIEKA